MSVKNQMSQATNAKKVEIKAKLDNIYPIIKLLRSKTGEEGTIIEQKDIYYRSREGKLKTRKYEKSADGLIAELIFYKRTYDSRSKVRLYRRIVLDKELYEQLHEVLSVALGVEATIAKKRISFNIRNTRIYIDDVYGLGFFIKLEVVLENGRIEENGYREIKQIMAELNISDQNVVDQSYLQMSSNLPEKYKGNWLQKLLNKNENMETQDNNYDLENVNLEPSWSQVLLKPSLKDKVKDTKPTNQVNILTAISLEPSHAVERDISWSDILKIGSKAHQIEPSIENKNPSILKFNLEEKFSL